MFYRFCIVSLCAIVVVALSAGCGRNDKAMPALHQAVCAGDVVKVLDLINGGRPIDELDSRGRTPLYLAALHGNSEIAGILVRNGADISIQSSWKSASTPLMVAAQKGDHATVELLLQSGAMINARSRAGNTALHFAAWSMCIGIAQYLIQQGADPRATNHVGDTPLHMEYRDEIGPNDPYEKMVRLLIDNGANAAAKNKWGRTPLLDACQIGNEQVVIYLLEHGAEIEPRPSSYLDPIVLASRRNHTNIVRILTRAAQLSDHDWPRQATNEIIR